MHRERVGYTDTHGRERSVRLTYALQVDKKLHIQESLALQDRDRTLALLTLEQRLIKQQVTTSYKFENTAKIPFGRMIYSFGRRGYYQESALLEKLLGLKKKSYQAPEDAQRATHIISAIDELVRDGYSEGIFMPTITVTPEYYTQWSSKWRSKISGEDKGSEY